MHTVPLVLGVHSSDRHRFSKTPQLAIRLLAGFGVEGDAHGGATVQHRYDRRKDPTRANLRQVHLLQSELLDEVGAAGWMVAPGELGENVTTRGLDLLALPEGTCLRLCPDAVVRLTGLRDPCVLIDRFRPGLLPLMHPRRRGEPYHPRSGVMSIVLESGTVHPNDAIEVRLPEGVRRPLRAV
jgi:MOSC domain-containing protein YiiM